MPYLKKILIITYYWPPSGGGGVMRWLKMSKFLPEFGWQPIIYTPENPDASVTDESLLNEIHPDIVELKTPIWEPYDFYRKLTGKKSETKFKAGYISEASSGDWKSKLSVFIRGNLMIPDPRKFWIKPSVKYLTQFLVDNKVDAMVSTGPPHSMHLIALEIKKNFDIPWIADFRDPWTQIDFYDKLRLTRWADKRHHKLEKKVLQNADHVVTVSPGCASDLVIIAGKKVEVIYNGFDHEDFEFNRPALDDTFTITHFGSFNKDRNPHSLWKALNELAGANDQFRKLLRIQLIGQTDASVINSIKENNLSANLELMDHLPHQDGLQKISKSQVLLLPINDAPNVQGILTGKMFEYLAIQRPILAIGPTNADFAKIIRETQSGVSVGFNDLQEMKEILSDYFDKFLQNKLEVKPTSIVQFSRKNLAKQFTGLFEK